jgi:hypothetical protein
MVIGASLGEGCASGGEPEPEPPPGGKPEPEGAVVVDSVVVSMLFLCVVFLRLRQQRPKPATTAGTHGRLDRRVVLMGVERAGGFYHKSALSSFEPREFRAPHPVEVTTV